MISQLEVQQNVDLDELERIVNELNTRSESDLLKLLGNTVYINNNSSAQKMNVTPTFPLTVSSILNVVDNLGNVDDQKAIMEGASFTQRIQNAICSSTEIRDILTGQATLRDYLVAGIPVVLTMIGASLNPVTLLAVATALAFILKIGYSTYCNLNTTNNGTN